MQPTDAVSWFNFGNQLGEQDRLQEARAAYREALRLDPQYADAHNNLGTALLGQGLYFHENVKEAMSHFRAALAIDPANEAASHNMAALAPKMEDCEVVDQFHRIYYGSSALHRAQWQGVPLYKYPADLWVYQEILWETRPDLIIETGTYAGGSALFLANMFDLLGDGRVVSIDVQYRPGRPVHPRISYMLGGSTDAQTIATVQASLAPRVMVILDSDHSQAHVARELELYAPLVTPGCYLVVEDTNVNGRPVLPEHGPGPAEAVACFLLDHPEFETDLSREKFFVTANPGGYLKRK